MCVKILSFLWVSHFCFQIEQRPTENPNGNMQFVHFLTFIALALVSTYAQEGGNNVIFPVRNEKGQVVFSVDGSGVTKLKRLEADSVTVAGNTNVMESLEALTQNLASSSEKQANDLTAILEKLEAAKKEEAAKTAAQQEKNTAALKELEERLVAESKQKVTAVRAELNALISKQGERMNALISIISKFDVSSDLEKLSTSAEAPAPAPKPKKKK